MIDKFGINNGSPITCLIDDIATKSENITSYGTTYNVTEELISLRYNIYRTYRKLTHFTSNKYPNELSEIYDERIISRLSEMCNIIEIKGIDFRTV